MDDQAHPGRFCRCQAAKANGVPSHEGAGGCCGANCGRHAPAVEQAAKQSPHPPLSLNETPETAERLSPGRALHVGICDRRDKNG